MKTDNDAILINKAKEILKKSKDKYHDINHSRAVLKNAKKLSTNYPEADKKALLIAAWWHDVGRVYKGNGHEVLSAKLVSAELKKLSYKKEFINIVSNAIKFHKWSMAPKTIEGKIIRDADKLDFISENRWKRCIMNKQYIHTMDTLLLLPKLRNEILKLDESKNLYDKRYPVFRNFLKKMHFPDEAMNEQIRQLR